MVRDHEAQAVLVYLVLESDARRLQKQGLVDRIRRVALGVSAFWALKPEDFLVARPVDGALVRIDNGSCLCTSTDADVCWQERYLGFSGPRGRSAAKADDGPCECGCHIRTRVALSAASLRRRS